MSLQRHSSPPDETDLEITAELPVLDVMAYEAGAAAKITSTTAAAGAPRSAGAGTHDREALGTTDTWLMPAPAARVTSAAPAEAANTAMDENRARLEINLQALSTTLRDVEERLTRKGERLAEIERALEAAVGERGASEQRARILANDLVQARSSATAAQTRVLELQKLLQEREAAEAAAQAREADLRAQLVETRIRSERQLEERTSQLRAQHVGHTSELEAGHAAHTSQLQRELTERTSQLQAQLAERTSHFETQLAERSRQFESQLDASQRDFEVKLAARAQAFSIVQQELVEARARATNYLETLQSNESRRSVFEELVSTLGADVERRDGQLARLEADLAAQVGRVQQLESALSERVARVAVLDKQVSALSAALAQRGEQQTDTERARDSLQQTVHSLNASLAQHADRVRSLEERLAEQGEAYGRQRSELELLSAERAQLLASAASLETALEGATARGEEQETAARAAQMRNEELGAELAAQRRRAEQLESEATAVRNELLSSSSALQAAAAERNGHMARIAAAESRVQELEARVGEQQETVRQLQAETNTSVARARELESDLRAAEEAVHRLEADLRAKAARVEELENVNHEWRATVEEARNAIAERDNLIHRLEQETANSAVLVGHIQRSITRLDHGSDHSHDPAPDGATRLLIRTDGDSEVVHVLGRKTSIGRTPDNDLQIDAKFISRHHAVILAGPAHAIIEDLNSTNGVLVNNRRITRQPLKDGDGVVIGKTHFRFAVRPAKS